LAHRPSSSGPGREPGVPPWLFNGLAIVVTTVWAVSFVVSAVPGSNYSPPAGVHGAMMIVLGAVFGARIARGGG